MYTDNQRLEGEGTGDNGELAVQATELEAERDSLCKKLKALYEGVLQTLQEVQVEQEKSQETFGVGATRSETSARAGGDGEIERLSERMELERAAEEKTKWEAKEERLLTLLCASCLDHNPQLLLQVGVFTSHLVLLLL